MILFRNPLSTSHDSDVTRSEYSVHEKSLKIDKNRLF